MSEPRTPLHLQLINVDVTGSSDGNRYIYICNMHQIGHYTHTNIKVQAISSSKPSPLITSPDGSLRVPSCSQASSDLVSGRRVPTKRSKIVRYASSYLSQRIGVNEVFAKEGWNKILKIGPS